MPSPRQIPTVTQEDLDAFHARIFGSPAPRQLFRTEQEPYNSAVSEEVFQEENDDLGYYPDGVKRTLTDDQVAMFRHSEIYSVLRERQVRKENLEAEGSEQCEPVSPPEETISTDEEGGVHSDGEVKEVQTMAAGTTPHFAEVTHARRKRKREGIDTGYSHGRKHASRSTRGIVRELDSAAAKDQILDYGDAPSAAEVPRELEAQTTEVTGPYPDSQARPAEGKKIWWPIIQAA